MEKVHTVNDTVHFMMVSRLSYSLCAMDKLYETFTNKQITLYTCVAPGIQLD